MLCNGKLSHQDRLVSFGCAKHQGMSRRRERLSLHSTQASIASENRVAHMRQGAHVVSSGLSKCSDAGMVLRMPCSVRGDPWRLLSRDPPMPDPVRSTLSCRPQVILRGDLAQPEQSKHATLPAGRLTGSSWASAPPHQTFFPQHQVILTSTLRTILSVFNHIMPKTQHPTSLCAFQGRTYKLGPQDDT